MPAKRLAGPAQLTGVAATKYTVPAGSRAIVRQLHFSNTSASAINVTVSIGADAAGTRIFDAFTIAAGAVYDHFCYYILAAAEIIQGFASIAAQCTLTIDGDEDLV